MVSMCLWLRFHAPSVILWPVKKLLYFSALCILWQGCRLKFALGAFTYRFELKDTLMTTQDIKATEDYNSIGHWNPDDGSDFIKNTHIPWLTNFVKKNVKAGVKGKWDKVIQRAIALSYRFYITSNASGQDVLREITGYGRSEVVSPRRLVQFCRAEWGGQN
jgi:hypothetical protein